MTTSDTLAEYLALEALVAAAERNGSSDAEQIRGSMDSLWLALTDADNAFLDARSDLGEGHG